MLSALDNGAHLRCIAENGNSILMAGLSNNIGSGGSASPSSIVLPASSIEWQKNAVNSSAAASSSSASSGSTGSTTTTHHQRHHQQQQSMNSNSNNVVNNPMAAFDQITLLVKCKWQLFGSFLYIAVWKPISDTTITTAAASLQCFVLSVQYSSSQFQLNNH